MLLDMLASDEGDKQRKRLDMIVEPFLLIRRARSPPPSDHELSLNTRPRTHFTHKLKSSVSSQLKTEFMQSAYLSSLATHALWG